MAPQVAPFGSWPSPISASSIARGGVQLGPVRVSAGGVCWSEQRPAESGRTVVVRRDPDGRIADVTPADFNVRTQVHEYGGGAWWTHDATVFFANWADQRLYRQDEGAEPVPITPEPSMPRGLRYADGVVTGDGDLIICVRERHVQGREAFNEIVAMPADGSAEAEILCGGNDFYAFPRPSPDGSRLAWTEWSHPNMPWDGTLLYVGDFAAGRVSNVRLVAGAGDESIFQPQWSPDGVLHYVSDRSGWWNIYREESDESLVGMDAEFGSPQWVFGQSRYAFLDTGDIVCAYQRLAADTLGIVRKGTARVEDLAVPYIWIGYVATDGRLAYCVGATSTEPMSLMAVDPVTAGKEVISRTRDPVDPAYVSVAEPISFDSDGRRAHAFFYPPQNGGFEAPPGEKPPLLVFTHGGPTGHVDASIKLVIQYWTSRGFAVVDVNYGGSTGYGRSYRRLLNGNWGVVDVQDCVNASRYLADRGDVDPDRLAIRGGSAGGFTTLAALVFTDVFKAGANYFGVADFETFVGDTHKFESRYLDTLVGPYPERKDLYFERSPANFVDRISAPVITFQGLEDAIVPPSQSEQIVEALRRKGIPCAYVTYEGEQHGFRKAENIIHSLESELYFYSRVFGFDPADAVEGVEIHNL